MSMDEPRRKLEWISLIYLIFFALAVLSPSIYARDYFGVPEAILEEATIFLFGLAGIMTFTRYERLVERREQEQAKIQSDLDRVKTELIESYAYIGSINRKFELVKSMANNTSLSVADRSRIPKELLQALTKNALAAVSAQAALLRIMDLDKLRTEAEFYAFQKEKVPFRVANRELKTLDERKGKHAFILTEDGQEVLVIPSAQADRQVKAFLILLLSETAVPEIDFSLLSVLVNQAAMAFQVSRPGVNETTQVKA